MCTAAHDDDPRATVLIVEDDDDVSEAVRSILATEGYRVAVAANGRLALDWLARPARPCLILLDLMMPVMSGLEFLQALQLDAAADVPVVVMSAYDPQAAGDAARSFLRKPLDLDRLLELVARHCGAACGPAAH